MGNKLRLYNKINKEELKTKMLASNQDRVTLSFYKYVHLDDPQEFRDRLYALLERLRVFGRIYVAGEGVNGQISIPQAELDSFRETLFGVPEIGPIRLNVAIDDDGKSFYKLTIKLRDKIVADGLQDSSFDVTNKGIHLDAKSFNELTDQEDTVVVDMRNHYESEIGHFEKALLPEAETFREALPEVIERLQDQKDKAIVMYCTGGIRCEKASAYLKHQGFEQVYQLDGGIIEYARQVTELGLPNKFHGKNFVFDERLGERISPEIISHCHQCGAPCDQHINCANDACHLLFIQCPACAEKFQHTCSSECKSFISLPLDEQKRQRKDRVFNGTRFGKSRYKAYHGSFSPEGISLK